MTDTLSAGSRAAPVKRGTKQTCENEACRSRFYDLLRVPCACPHCGSTCDEPAIAIVNFETLGKVPMRKFNKHLEAKKPVIEATKADEKADSDNEISPAGEVVLIEDDDEDTEVAEQAPEEDSDDVE